MRFRRLETADRDLARSLFLLMAEVFEAESEQLSDGYVERLLADPSFWVIAAWDGEQLVGGLTAHTLPMTRTEASELFVYDIAVRRAQQRRGVGRGLVTELLRAAAALGIGNMFVGADDEDTHALDFYRALGGVASKVTHFDFVSRGK
jgi:aminoglycoside 3-N-acetyltransferase I